MRHIVNWLTVGPNQEAIQAINTQRDRGAAIIASAMVEDHLTKAIQARLERAASIEKKIFRGYGPLATFSAKIDLAFLLGVYPKTVHRNLHIIRKIRNEFAHNLSPISFRSPQLRDWCKNLLLSHRARIKTIRLSGQDLVEPKIDFNRIEHIRSPCAS